MVEKKIHAKFDMLLTYRGVSFGYLKTQFLNIQ